MSNRGVSRREQTRLRHCQNNRMASHRNHQSRRLRPISPGRRNWPFAWTELGAERRRRDAQPTGYLHATRRGGIQSCDGPSLNLTRRPRWPIWLGISDRILVEYAQGYAEAQYYLSVIGQKGSGAPQDAAESAKWTPRAAEQLRGGIASGPQEMVRGNRCSNIQLRYVRTQALQSVATFACIRSPLCTVTRILYHGVPHNMLHATYCATCCGGPYVAVIPTCIVKRRWSRKHRNIFFGRHNDFRKSHQALLFFPRPVRPRLGGIAKCERFRFHFEINFGIDVRCVDAGMPEPSPDRVDVYLRAHQLAGCGVAQNVRSNSPTGQHRDLVRTTLNQPIDPEPGVRLSITC